MREWRASVQYVLGLGWAWGWRRLRNRLLLEWKLRGFSSSEGLLGPYDSLIAALKENDGLLMVTPSTESINCESLSGEAIAAMLWSEADEPLAFKINGEQWKYEKRGRLPNRPRQSRLGGEQPEQQFAQEEV